MKNGATVGAKDFLTLSATLLNAMAFGTAQQKFRGDISEYEEVFTGALNDYLIEHEKAKEEDLDRSALIAQLEEILEKLLK